MISPSHVVGLLPLPRPSNVVPFWVWYGFLVRIFFWGYQKGTTLEGLGKP